MSNRRICWIGANSERQEHWKKALKSVDADIQFTGEVTLSLKPHEADNADIFVVEARGVSADDLEICRRLHRWFSAPILLVAHDGSEEHAAHAYDAGVTECTSTLTSDELLCAKLNAWLRWLERPSMQPNQAPLSEDQQAKTTQHKN